LDLNEVNGNEWEEKRIDLHLGIIHNLNYHNANDDTMVTTTSAKPENDGTTRRSKLQPWMCYTFLYMLILVYRLLNAVILQTQFDPDEYWQTLEPAYCLAFSTEHNCAFTWEWTRRLGTESGALTQLKWVEEALHGPVRSHLPILPTYVLYKIIKMFHLDSPWMIARAPVLLNAAIVAAPTDFSVYYISRWIFSRTEVNVKGKGIFYSVETWVLLASITNWFNGYALVRTYSNSMETTLLSVGMAILCPELFGAVQDKTEYRVRPIAQLAFFLGGMSVVIRFTALAAWVPLGLIICFRRKTIWSSMFYLWHLCIVSGFTGVALGCVIDRYFYGFWALPFLGSFHFNVLLGTWNFASDLITISPTYSTIVYFQRKRVSIWNSPMVLVHSSWTTSHCRHFDPAISF